MKKALLLFAAALFVQLTFAQEGTTLEEYNYITKGLDIQMKSGLDMKKGYELKPIFSATEGNRSVSFSELLKGTDKRAIVADITWTSKKHTYFCIPNEFTEKEVQELSTK